MPDTKKIISNISNALRYNLNLNSEDSFVVIAHDNSSEEIAKYIERSAKSLNINYSRICFGNSRPYKKEIVPSIIDKIENIDPDAVIGLFNYENYNGYEIKELDMRIAWFDNVKSKWKYAHAPGITLKMMESGAMSADFSAMNSFSNYIINNKLKDIRKFHITSSEGTDYWIIVDDLKPQTDCPINSDGGNWPPGEIWYEKPMENNEMMPLKGYGKIVCNVSVGNICQKIDKNKPIIVEVNEENQIENIIYGEPKFEKLNEALFGNNEKAFTQELGLPINFKANITGNMLEDEKKAGTAHIALGLKNTHVDFLMWKPTIVGYNSNEDEIVIMNRGVYDFS